MRKDNILMGLMNIISNECNEEKSLLTISMLMLSQGNLHSGVIFYV